MNLEMRIKDIEVRLVSNDGRASVAAKRKFLGGEVIECCPIALLNQKESYFVEETKLVGACYRWKKMWVLPGGYGGVYLPSKEPNASFRILPKKRRLIITADKTIYPGEQVFVNRGFFPSPMPKVKYNEPSPWHSDGLIVKPSSSHGLGTFTTKKFKKGELIEVSHLFCLTEKESWLLKKTDIHGFMYTQGSRGQLTGWALGYPCFYNHSDTPNIDPWGQLEHITFRHLAVRALKDLKPDTELVFDYLDGLDKKNLGFEVR